MYKKHKLKNMSRLKITNQKKISFKKQWKLIECIWKTFFVNLQNQLCHFKNLCIYANRFYGNTRLCGCQSESTC